MKPLFRDRRDAGRALAAKLLVSTNVATPAVVLALPRGAVQVAFEVACAFRSPLDVCVVRRLEVPKREGVVMGAIVSNSVLILLQAVVKEFAVTEQELIKAIRKQAKELARHERAYRGDREAVALKGESVILVDDGLTDGASLKTAIAAIRLRGAERLTLAMPTTSMQGYRDLKPLADDLICFEEPVPAHAIAPWYAELAEVSDLEVRRLHAQARGIAQRWPYLN